MSDFNINLSFVDTVSLQKLQNFTDIYNDYYLIPEKRIITELQNFLQITDSRQENIANLATHFIHTVRENKNKLNNIDQLMLTYNLSNSEGISLMCLAESLLRIPDKKNKYRIIADKLSGGDWLQYIKKDNSLFINSASWALMLTGKIARPTSNNISILKNSLNTFVQRSSSSVIRGAITYAMNILSKQFVFSETIENAMQICTKNQNKQLYSFDMLGEAARTNDDAERYFHDYLHAIEQIGSQGTSDDLYANQSISIKLSALDPRYTWQHRYRVFTTLYERLYKLIAKAQQYNISVTIDAEETALLNISLEILAKLCTEKDFKNWHGIGLALQAYQRRSFAVIDFLTTLSNKYQRKIPLRLVKGAYWDYEIKLAQEEGLDDYPVFTRKCNTDISYLACAQKILQNYDCFYPQFATHNAYTLSAVLNFIKPGQRIELQRLYGMGEILHNTAAKKYTHCNYRVYAPIGEQQYLLPYLMRRLLENGANSSFINRIIDDNLPISALTVSPLTQLQQFKTVSHKHIPLPANIYQNQHSQRINSAGINLCDQQVLLQLSKQLQSYNDKYQYIHSLPNNKKSLHKQKKHIIRNPANFDHILGDVVFADTKLVNEFFNCAQQYVNNWQQCSVLQRANYLRLFANKLEENSDKFIYYLLHEAGKTIHNAIGEIREAVDFCRYYAEQAENLMQKPQVLLGPTGEENSLYYDSRGIVICISPWNFPLAIFIGQIAASLVTGNVVIAKPAEQSNILAYLAINLLYECGVPQQALYLVCGLGEEVGHQLVSDERVAAVLFTGSTKTAKLIQKQVNQREEEIVPLIAETGGLNAMLIDSSALLEQAVDDVMQSAFDSAGQRCSALRIVFVQDDIAENFITMLIGAMNAVNVDNPIFLHTDIGPMIDAAAKQNIHDYVQEMKERGVKLLHKTQLILNQRLKNGFFQSLYLYEIDSITELNREIFGPVLHLVRFSLKSLPRIIDEINNTGYGLTFGIHSRINFVANEIVAKIKAGNIYVNRNIIGATVGVQPFGGERKSGTGPKAGGPDYLKQLCIARSLSINTAAVGGNASLLCLAEE